MLLSVTRQIDASTSAITKFEYGDAANPGLPTRIIAPRGNTSATPDYQFATSLAYDPKGNVASRTDADDNRTNFAYDLAGRLTSVVDPDGGLFPAQHTWTIAYDANDRETRRADPLGNALVYGYDGAGNRTRLTDRNGNVTTYAYDANTRLASVQQQPDPAGSPTLTYTTTVGRDANGNATRVTQANGVATDYAYDELNRLTAVTTHPTPTTNLTTSYVLDGNGQPTSRTAGDGVIVSYGYDALSRLVSVGATGVSISYLYDELGRRTKMVDATGATTYNYDGLGRLTQVAAPAGTLGYAYDLDGNRTSLTYPGNVSLVSTYTPGGLVSLLMDWANHVTTPSWSSSGLFLGGSGAPGSQSYTYDRAQRLVGVDTAIGASSSLGYTLDAEGNRVGLSEDRTFPAASSESFAYRYDGLNRLTSVTGPVAESFTLDGATNLSSRTGPAASFTYDGANKLLSDGTRTFTWSAADRLTQRGADTFVYDALGRMTTSTVGGVARTYAYNGDGLLASRTEGATTTTFLWDVSVSPASLVQAGSDRVVNLAGPLYLVRGDNSMLGYAKDALGSVRLETNDGLPVKSFRYTAYGAIAQSSGGSPTLFGFAGELQDPSGLIYLRARWYDPAVGRLTSPDPLPGSPARPKSLSAYPYAQANPVVNIDPSGLLCVGVSFGGSGILGLGANGLAGTTSIGLVLCGGGDRGLNVGTVMSVGAFAGGPNDPGAIGRTRANIAAGAYAGFGLAGLVSPNATQVRDLGKAFRSETVNLGIGPLNGSVEYLAGRNDVGRAIDVIAVTPPFLSVGLGASYSLLTTWTITQDLWSQSASRK